MAAPSLFDGISRAIKEIGVPSVGLVGLIWLINVFYGGQEAGLAYLAITVFGLAGIYVTAKYWNTRYTLGFVLAGIGWSVGVPGVVPFLIPSLFADLSKVVGFVFLILMALKIFDKIE